MVLASVARSYASAWSPGSIAILSFCVALVMGLDLYQLWLIRRFLFPRMREQRVRIRRDIWQGAEG